MHAKNLFSNSNQVEKYESSKMETIDNRPYKQ